MIAIEEYRYEDGHVEYYPTIYDEETETHSYTCRECGESQDDFRDIIQELPENNPKPSDREQLIDRVLGITS